MSVLFLPPSATSVPDATETVSGKIRIATSAEATAGTLDSAAMTPLKVKSVVDAAVVGGVTYQGTFNTSAPVDLSNAQKGDLYIISVAGSYQGQTWAVGDHLLVNADMGGTISPSKIDKVDNTDAVTSVAGKTGAVTLVAGDVSGLAAVATSGAYSDLSGTPTLATVATTGAYSDLSGTPTLGTAAAEDVGTLAGNVVQLDGTAKLPAVDGSQLTNLPSGVTTLGALTDVDVTGAANTNVLKYNSTSGNWEDGAVAYSEVTGTPALATVATTGAYSDLSGTPTNVSTFTNDAGYLTAITGESVGDLSDVTLTTPSAGQALVYNGTLSVFENATVSASVAAIDDIGDVTITGVSDREALVYDSGTSQWVNGSAANTVVESFSTTPASTVVIDTQDLHEIRMTGSGGFTVTISATADGLGAPILFNNTSTGDCTLSTTGSAQHFSSNGSVSGSQTTTIKSGERRLFYVMNASRFMEVNATDLDRLADVSISSPSSGQALVYNGTLSVFENATISAGSSTLGALTDVDVTGAVNTNVLKYNSTSGNWEDGAVAYSEVTGTPTLGTAAAEDVGTLAGNVVQLDGTAKLPAVDGSQLTNLPAAPVTSVAGKTGVVTLDLNDNTDVSYTPGAGIDNYVLTYDHGTTSWGAEAVPAGAPASETVAGIIEISTNAEATGATATDKALVPSNLSSINVSTLNNDAGYITSAPVDSVAGKTGVVTLDLNDNTDVSYTPGAGIDNYVLTYDHATTSWGAEPSAGGGGSAPTVTVDTSTSVDQTLSPPSTGVIEEVYIYTPSAAINVNLVAAATVGSGFKYQIKNRSTTAATNTLTIDPSGSETIDGASTVVINTQEASLTLITDGSNWFII